MQTISLVWFSLVGSRLDQTAFPDAVQSAEKLELYRILIIGGTAALDLQGCILHIHQNLPIQILLLNYRIQFKITFLLKLYQKNYLTRDSFQVFIQICPFCACKY